MIEKTIETVFTLVIILGMGYLISYLGWYKKEHKSFLSALILKVAIPSLVIKNLLIDFTKQELFQSTRLLLMNLIGVISLLLISFILSKILRMEEERRTSFISSASLGNIMFIGLPVATTLFGEGAVSYVMIIYLVSNILLWLVFAPMFREKSDKKSLMDQVKERLKNLVSIPLVTMGISMTLLLLGVELPKIITRPIVILGGMGTPLALIFIGGVMYEVGFKNLKLERDTLIVVLLRFLISPSIMFFLAKGFGLEDLQVQVFTVLAGMPGMTQIGVIADTYSDDSEFVMTNIVVTTLLSLAFIPITMMVLDCVL